MKSLRRKVLHGMGWVGVSAVLQTVSQIGIVAVLGRLLTPVEFGLMALASSTVGYANVLGRFGFSNAVVQRKELKDEHLRVAFWSTLILSLLICGAFYLISGTVGHFYSEPDLPRLIRLLAWGPVISALSSASGPVLVRELRFKELTIINVLSYFVGYGFVGILLATFDYGPFALVFGMLSQRALKTMGILARALPPLVGVFGMQHLRDLAGYATGQVMARVANRVAKSADYLIIGSILGTSAVGLYERSYRLIDLARLRITEAADQVLFPALSKKQDELATTLKPYYAIHTTIVVALVPAAAFCVLLAPEFIQLLLGNEWLGAIPVFQVLVVGLPLQADIRIAGLVLRSTGDMRSFAVTKWLYAILVVAGSFIGAQISLLAAAWFINIAIVVHLVSIFFVISRQGKTGMWRHFRPYVSALIVAAVTVVVTGAVVWAVRMAGLPDIVVLTVCALAAVIAAAGFVRWRKGLIDVEAREYAAWLIRRYLSSRFSGKNARDKGPEDGQTITQEKGSDR